MKYTITFPENYVKPKLPNKEVWTQALRSGEYKQGKKALLIKGEEGERYHCCLGVLCEVEKVQGDASNSGLLQLDTPWFNGLSYTGTFPPGVHVKDSRTLAALNDRGYSFNEIADIIDQIWD